jgi:hypothetical protein
MFSEWWIGKDVEGDGPDLIRDIIPAFGGTEANHFESGGTADPCSYIWIEHTSNNKRECRSLKSGVRWKEIINSDIPIFGKPCSLYRKVHLYWKVRAVVLQNRLSNRSSLWQAYCRRTYPRKPKEIFSILMDPGCLLYRLILSRIWGAWLIEGFWIGWLDISHLFTPFGTSGNYSAIAIYKIYRSLLHPH